MDNKPLITIIVPIYNAENSIEKCVESILQQTYKNIEILLINDGSTDSSSDVCNNLKKIDSRIKFIDKKNEKVSKTRNLGIELSCGEYICFVDSDDFIYNEMIMELYNNIQGYDLCTCNYYIKKDRNIKVNSNIDEFDVNKSELYMYIEKMQKDFLFNPLWNKIYKASIIKENNIRFEETIQNGEDYLFNVVYLQYVTKANYISHPLYYYVINEKSLTKKYTKRDVKSELKIVHALRNFYVKNSFEMKYVYNQYIELFKNNMINLQNGELEKDQKKLITKQFVCEFKKEDIKKGNLTLENRILYNLIYKERINLIKHYFKFRNDIKNILK